MMRAFFISVLALVPVTVSISSSTARAEDVYRLAPELDLPLLGLGLAGTMLVFVETASPSCLPTCSDERISGFDRIALGNYSESAHTAADVLVFASVLIPATVGFLEDGLEQGGEEALVILEAVLLAEALTQLVKAAVDRPAPLVYDRSVPGEVKTSRDAARSFISGHTTVASAALAAANVTLWSKEPNSVLAWSALGVSAVTTVAVGLLKIAAGYHFPTDVIAGALAGASIGVLTAFAHK